MKNRIFTFILILSSYSAQEAFGADARLKTNRNPPEYTNDAINNQTEALRIVRDLQMEHTKQVLEINNKFQREQDAYRKQLAVNRETNLNILLTMKIKQKEHESWLKKFNDDFNEKILKSKISELKILLDKIQQTSKLETNKNKPM